jgi:hypothetical protein
MSINNRQINRLRVEVNRDMKSLRQLLFVVMCGALILQPCARIGTLGAIPRTPVPPQDVPKYLSTDDAQAQVVKWAKYGTQPDTNTIIDTGISIISVGFPPAGAALGFFKQFLLSGATGSDPVGDALNVINNHLADIDQHLNTLDQEVKQINNRISKVENQNRIDNLRTYRKNVQDGSDQLRLFPTAAFDKQTIANQAGTTADLFLNDDDLWNWSDLHVFTAFKDDQTGQLTSRQPTHSDPTGQLTSDGYLPAHFEPQPTLDVYASALVLWMSAIEYASGGDPRKVTTNKPLVNDLLRHAAYLSVRPSWHEADSSNSADPPKTLPEYILRGVDSETQPVTTYPTNGICNASRFVDDTFRRTRTLVDTAQFSVPSGNSQCTFSMPKPKAMPADANRTDLYGSDAMSLWDQWRAQLAAAKEDELERSYGVEVMTLLADRLAHLAKFGTTRDQLIGTFDPATYSQQFIYAVKPNGELLWYRDLMTTKPPQQTRPKNPWLIKEAASMAVASTSASTSNSSTAINMAAAKAVVGQSAATGSPAGRRKAEESITRDLSAEPATITTHFLDGPKMVNSQWQQFRDVIPAGLNGIYVLTKDGLLKWYSHDGFIDGSPNWKGPTTVGNGWQGFSRIVAGGDGVVYGITPDGLIKWYKHNGYIDGTAVNGWSGPIDVDQVVRRGVVTTRVTNWANFKQVFSGGEGILYGVSNDGVLTWFHHSGYLNGTVQWEGPKNVGTGWQNFKKVFSPGDGNIYALTTGGDLLWYKHEGYKDGSARWQGPVTIAHGWQDFLFVFPRIWGTWQPPVVR